MYITYLSGFRHKITHFVWKSIITMIWDLALLLFLRIWLLKVCIYTYLYIYIYTRTYIFIYIYTHIYIYIYLYIYIYISYIFISSNSLLVIQPRPKKRHIQGDLTSLATLCKPRSARQKAMDGWNWLDGFCDGKSQSINGWLGVYPFFRKLSYWGWI